ncbi:MAG: G2-specific serine/threonine protein kinase [Alyxoria varia]|nr:MAG: G2-specific serine/threonine protein kinase [Alyxoria varia]
MSLVEITLTYYHAEKNEYTYVSYPTTNRDTSSQDPFFTPPTTPPRTSPIFGRFGHSDYSIRASHGKENNEVIPGLGGAQGVPCFDSPTWEQLQSKQQAESLELQQAFYTPTKKSQDTAPLFGRFGNPDCNPNSLDENAFEGEIPGLGGAKGVPCRISPIWEEVQAKQLAEANHGVEVVEWAYRDDAILLDGGWGVEATPANGGGWADEPMPNLGVPKFLPFKPDPVPFHYERGYTLGKGGQGEVSLWQKRPELAIEYLLPGEFEYVYDQPVLPKQFTQDQRSMVNRKQRQHSDLPELLAVKITQLGSCPVEKFYEMERLFKIRGPHPNILEVFYDTHLIEGTCIRSLMHHCNGGDLDQLQRRYRRWNDKLADGAPQLIIPEAFMWHVVSQVASALAFLHQAAPVSIVHCDVKPENVMLHGDFYAKSGRFPDCKVMDFDIATVYTPGKRYYGGTWEYQPPEVRGQSPDWLQYENTASPSSDVWALGGIIMKLAGKGKPGEQPLPNWFIRKYGNPSKMERNDLRRLRPRGVNDIGDCYSASLNKLMMRALDRNPETRATAQEIADTARAPAALWATIKGTELPIEPEYNEHEDIMAEGCDTADERWEASNCTQSGQPSWEGTQDRNDRDHPASSTDQQQPVESAHQAAGEIQPKFQDPPGQIDEGISHLVTRLRASALHDGNAFHANHFAPAVFERFNIGASPVQEPPSPPSDGISHLIRRLRENAVRDGMVY